MNANKFIKKTLILTAVLVIVSAVSACGEKKDDADNKEKAKTYIVGTEPTFAPFDTTDEEGNIIGFDMDLMNAIAKDQGFKVEFKSFGFDALIPAVNSKNCDIIAAGMNAEDEERAKKVDFSKTYYDSGNVVLVKSDNEKITGVDSLTKDMTIAVQIGTTGADKANELKEQGKIKEVKVNDGVDVCLLQVKNGDVDALIVDKPVAERAVKANDGFKVVGETLNAESYGFAVAKGNTELLEKINKGLENIKKDGTYDKIFKKWFEGK